MLLRKNKYVCPNCGYTEDRLKRKDYEYLWYCPKCDDYFFSDKKENVFCPYCGTEAELFKGYKHDPKKPYDVKYESMGKNEEFVVMVEPILFINTDHPFCSIMTTKRRYINILMPYVSLVCNFWQDKDAKDNKSMIEYMKTELHQLTEDNIRLNKDNSDNSDEQ
jgi:DNA-directed RNA polymerase subunit RPC12/RpoP